MDFPMTLCSRGDRQLAQQLVEAEGLRFEAGIDELLGIFKDTELVACGARAGRVLKMLVVSPQHRGEGLIGQLVSELLRLGGEAGESGFFIFSRRCAVESFTRLGFRPLVSHGGISWLERGSELHHYLAKRAPLMRSGNNAAVWVNANPFTLGHARLVEEAASLADNVYVFVHAEGPYLFPLAARLEMARLGVAHVANALVTDTGPYRLRADGFPGYFLRAEDDPERLRVGLEGELFAQHLAPPFDIHLRVVGSEPLDPAGRSYHQLIRPHLEGRDIRLVEIQREKLGDLWISTRRVRKALGDDDHQTLAASLPEAVHDYLRLPAMRALIDSSYRTNPTG